MANFKGDMGDRLRMAHKKVFSKKAMVNGFEVEVTYTKLSDGTIRISDAWVNQ